ncbi:MAG TPA: glycosyltransferase, partial [Solirubrobacteraceae bacterium]
MLDVPLVGSYHTELALYAGLRTGQAHLELMAAAALSKFYGGCDVVLSPSPATDQRLLGLGISEAQIGRWDRGVDLDRFDPSLRDPSSMPG